MQQGAGFTLRLKNGHHTIRAEASTVDEVFRERFKVEGELWYQLNWDPKFPPHFNSMKRLKPLLWE